MSNNNNRHQNPPLADDEESYYSEEEVTCTEEDGDVDDFEYKEIEKEIYNRMGGPPPEVAKVMGKPTTKAAVTPQRPPHPLMGNGSGAPGRNAFLDQIKARGATPASTESTSSNNGKENIVPTSKKAVTPVAAPSIQQRPPHPLFGGGGADGGGGKSALLDQIKARGATTPSAQGSGSSANIPTSVTKVSPPPPPPPSKKPLASMSMAEQVAAMAKKRQERLDASEASNSQANDDNDNVQESKPIQQTPTPVVTNTSTTALSTPKTLSSNHASPGTAASYIKPTASNATTTKTVAVSKKEDTTANSKKNGRSGVGGFFGGKKNDTSAVPGTKVISVKSPVVVETPTKPDTTAEEVTIIKSYKPEPLPLPQKPTVPVFAQAKLKPVSREAPSATTTTTSVTTDEVVVPTTTNTNDQQVLEEMAPAKVTTTTTTTTIVTKTKRIIRSDPEYDVTEYKLGCACNVM